MILLKYLTKGVNALLGVIISNEVMKGVVFLPVGAWYDPINDGEFCIHGNPNVLTEDIGTSSLAQGPSAHSTLVEIKKYTKELPEINFYINPTL